MTAIHAYYTLRLMAAGETLRSEGRDWYTLTHGQNTWDVPTDAAKQLIHMGMIERSGATLEHTYWRVTPDGWETLKRGEL